MSELVPLPASLKPFLAEYLPKKTTDDRPFVTLTYAQSLDSRISAAKGQQTAISHLETKTMTHYIRSKHDGILVGAGTAAADDPGLNCRYKENENSPANSTIRPIVIDPTFRWQLTEDSRVINTAKQGLGLAPFVIVRKGQRGIEAKKNILEKYGGKILELDTDKNGQISWLSIFKLLKNEGIQSVMVEGGAVIINTLLEEPSLIDSLIVTIGPVYLGKKGVEVSPSSKASLTNMAWWTGTQDSVLAARLVELRDT